MGNNNHRASIVLGLGFGDEGKGLTTSYLAHYVQADNPIVVRFSGGQQAGHTVIVDGKKHIFANFGSGTLQGIPTYWSQYCTFCPGDVVREYKALVELGCNPTLIVHPLCPVTTPYDIIMNRRSYQMSKNGTCGMGVGTTWKRHEEYYKLYVQDLMYPSVTTAKLSLIKKYYQENYHQFEWGQLFGIWENCIKQFMEECEVVMHIIEVQRAPGHNFDHYIFEGSQGILLDMDFGFFPHVTRSNTTSKNALALWGEWKYTNASPEIYYVSRVYQTRHGAGFMTNQGLPLVLENTEGETNTFGEYQGKFRTTVLDLDLLYYAIMCDNNFSNNCNKNLVFTCIDQLPTNRIYFTSKAHQQILDADFLARDICINMSFNSAFGSKGPNLHDQFRLL